MKTIGIVGGIAWPSSIVYYRLINEMVSERLGDGGLHSARLVLAEADFDEIERCQREGRWDCVGEILAAEARSWPPRARSCAWPALTSSCWLATPLNCRPAG